MYTSDMKNLGSRWTGPNIPLRTAAARSLLVAAIIPPKRLIGRPKHNIKSYNRKNDERCSTDNNNNNKIINIISSNEKVREIKQAGKARSRRSNCNISKKNNNNNNNRKSVVQKLHLSVRSYKTSLYITTNNAIATATTIKTHSTKILRNHQLEKQLISIGKSLPFCLALRYPRHQRINYCSSPKTPSRHFRKC